MKRKLAILALAACLLISLAACEKKPATDPDVTGDAAVTTAQGGATTGTSYKYLDEDYSKYVKLGEYKGVKVTKQDITVTDDEIQAEIDSMLASFPVYTVIDRAAAIGDSVNIDYEGKIDGTAFQGGTAQNQYVVLGSNSMVEGFEAGIVGAKAGETKEVTVTFPDNYTAELAGKKAVFTIKVNSVNTAALPTLDDAFIAKNVQGYKTVAEYKKYLNDAIKADKETSAQQNKQSEAWTAVTAACTIESYPQAKIDAYINQMTEYYTNLAKDESKELEAYLTDTFQMKKSEFDAEAKSLAEQVVGEELIIFAIADAEKIEITDAIYQEGAQKYVDMYKAYGIASIADLESQFGKEDIMKTIVWDKVIEVVLNSAVEA